MTCPVSFEVHDLHFDLKFSDLRKLWQSARKFGNRRHSFVMSDRDEKPRTSRLFANPPQCQKRINTGLPRSQASVVWRRLKPGLEFSSSQVRGAVFGWPKAVKVS
jgi:hypothetical protein